MTLTVSPALLKDVTLNTINGICNEFKRHHYRWPKPASTEAEFLEAKIHGVNGLVLQGLLRTGLNGLENDREYQEFANLCVGRGLHHAQLEALDPHVRFWLTDADARQLIDGIGFDWKTGSYDPRTRPEKSLHLHLPPNMRKEAYDLIGIARWQDGMGREDAWVPLTPELASTIDAAGVVYEVNDRNFYMEITESSRLYAKYASIIGGRCVYELTPAMRDALVERYAVAIAERANKHKLPCAPLVQDFLRRQAAGNGQRSFGDAPSAVPLSLATASVSIPSPVTEKESDMARASSAVTPEVLAELNLLTAEGNEIRLPTQQLQHYPKIKTLLQTAGGKYVSRGAKFTFAAGYDAAAILEKLQGGSISNDKKVNQFFATPAGLATEVVDDAGPCKGKRFLEPSAGDGALADIARERGAEVVTIENWDVNVIKLQSKGYEPIQRDFLTVTPQEIGQFDAIIANPPFSRNQDVDHVMHMFQFLKPGGTLSVIMGTSWQRGTQKKQQQFRDFLAEQNVEITEVEAGTFSESGTSVPTVRLVFPDYQPVMRNAIEEDEAEEMSAPSM